MTIAELIAERAEITERAETVREELRALQQAQRVVTEQAVRLLVEQGAFDALSVRWDRFTPRMRRACQTCGR
jgi:hypothetical protein